MALLRGRAGFGAPNPPPGSPPAFWRPWHTPHAGQALHGLESPPGLAPSQWCSSRGCLCPRGTRGSIWGSLIVRERRVRLAPDGLRPGTQLHTLGCSGRPLPQDRFTRPRMSAAPRVRRPGAWGQGGAYGTTQPAPISAFLPQNTERSSSQREVCCIFPEGLCLPIHTMGLMVPTSWGREGPSCHRRASPRRGVGAIHASYSSDHQAAGERVWGGREGGQER